MNKSTIIIIIYVIGLIFGALVLDMWSAETSPKALLGIGWTALLLVGLFFTEKMREINLFKIILIISLFLIPLNHSYAETIILSSCDNKKDGFLKNEYILDLKKSLMTRSYIYNDRTFKKYKMTDLSVKKTNTIERFIYIENDLILTDKIGYPQFYTQLLFKINDPTIKIKTVINNEEGITEMSNCKKIERFKEES